VQTVTSWDIKAQYGVRCMPSLTMQGLRHQGLKLLTVCYNHLHYLYQNS